MQWDYANPLQPSLEEVAREVNGQELATGRQLSGFGELKDDGSTVCGNVTPVRSIIDSVSQTNRIPPAEVARLKAEYGIEQEHACRAGNATQARQGKPSLTHMSAKDAANFRQWFPRVFD